MQVFVELVTAHLSVDGTAEEARFEVARRTTETRVEIAGNQHYRVAKLLGVKTLFLIAPVEAIAGIFGKITGFVFACQLVDRAQHYFFVQLLDRLPALHKSSGKIFEEFRIGRTFSRDPKITWRVYQARSEVPLPDAVHDDARAEWLFEYRLCQLQTSAALLKRLGIIGRKHTQEVTRYFFANLHGIAANGKWQF